MTIPELMKHLQRWSGNPAIVSVRIEFGRRLYLQSSSPTWCADFSTRGCSCSAWQARWATDARQNEKVPEVIRMTAFIIILAVTIVLLVRQAYAASHAHLPQ